MDNTISNRRAKCNKELVANKNRSLHLAGFGHKYEIYMVDRPAAPNQTISRAIGLIEICNNWILRQIRNHRKLLYISNNQRGGFMLAYLLMQIFTGLIQCANKQLHQNRSSEKIM
jgi:hypothetical protein